MAKFPLLLTLLAAYCCGKPALGETVYRSISPDGRVVYSDQPPTAGKVQQVYSFDDLPASPVPESVLRYRQGLEKGIKKRLTQAALPSGTQLYTATWCGYCRKAKAYLGERGVAYQEIDIDTPDGAQAYVQAGGGSGVPLLIWKGQRVQGFSRNAYDNLFGKGR